MAIYRSYIDGIRFVAEDGTEHFFVGGVLETKDKGLIAALDAVVALPGSVIYQDAAVSPVNAAAQRAAAIQQAAAAAAAANGQSGA